LPSSGYPQSHSGVERALFEGSKLRGEAIDLGLIGIEFGGFGFSSGFHVFGDLGEISHHHGAAPAKRRSIKA
jgi:hypothetical protein